jgi:hypothetical protein
MADEAGARVALLPLPGERQLAWAGLCCLVVLAVALRLVPTVFVPSTNWADEIFQSTEQAHRLVYGYGLVPWEFQLGMRSWLLPAVVASLIELARLVGDGPGYYLPAIATGFGLLASAPVVCVFLWCRRAFGPAPACAAAAAVAVAPELVYFGARTLTEVAAAHLLVLACYLVAPGRRGASRRRLVVAGLLLGLTCLLRVQLVPAVAVVALWPVRGGWAARLAALAGGGSAALAGGALLDWLTLDYPFASIWRNLVYNGFQAVGSDISTAAWYLYLFGELGVWLSAAPFVLLLVGLGARRMPALSVAALVVIAVHSAIPHKEYRFIYPAVLLLMVLAAIGLAEAARWTAMRLQRCGLRPSAAAPAAALGLASVWAAGSYYVWSSGYIAELRQRDHDNLRAMSFVAQASPAPCGVGLYGGQAWDRFGGYSHLHRPVAMFWPEDAAELAAEAPAFDMLLYRAAPPPGLGFAPIRCFGETCVARRPGRCQPRAMAATWYPPQLLPYAPPRDTFEAVPPRLRAQQ